MPTWLHGALSTIRDHRKAFIALNLAFYGFFGLCMLVAAFLPDLQTGSLTAADPVLPRADQLRFAGHAYTQGEPWMSIAVSYLVDLIASILPSLVSSATYQEASMWNSLVPQIGPDFDSFMPHSLTFTIKGEAYVLTAFALYVQLRMSLWPRRYGLASRRSGIVAGALNTARLSIFIVVALGFGLVYESFDAVHYLPLLR
ncbi:MAG: hypothetical protein GAK28_03157 [Luteibacter sp.]|uniref:hypothetical protein n=1 Tax=Luteibacter sp. TaxID=1886636 RepID=UPI001382194B|nr:hypothetical protein [Luteibacter sp.]KAF1005675.1 MAG: hypothetical protein GAK28_03157 [Luteibacter sp.]